MDEIRTEEFNRLVLYMRRTYGIDLERKFDLVRTRLTPVLQKRGIRTLTDYLNLVQADESGEESGELVTHLTTNYTFFMREMPHYDFLKRVALPEITPKLHDRDLRIWSAGCSSGEEAYSAAMMMDDWFGARKAEWNTQVLATDISVQSLRMAGEGVYPKDRLQKMSAAQISKYFTEIRPGSFRLQDATRREAQFRIFNLMEAAYSFRRNFHIIFCRNVMIYFNRETTDEVLRKFHAALEPGGYLFVGLAESVDKGSSLFRYIEPSVYQKI